MTVRELIGGEVTWIEPSATLREAARQMHESDKGHSPVESEGALQGTFTERDLTRAFADCVEPEVALIEDWMTPYPDSFGRTCPWRPLRPGCSLPANGTYRWSRAQL